MAKKFRHIPLPNGRNNDDANRAVADAVQFITGQRVSKIQKLPESATLAEAVAKINEIIERLQGD